MHELSRTVRFCINPGAGLDAASSSPAVNGYGSHPAMRGLGRYYELDVCLRGEPDGQTGYLVNIKEIDREVRRVSVPVIARACENDPDREPYGVIHAVVDSLRGAYGEALRAVTWRMTPYYEVAMDMQSPDRVVLRQSFDFCAAHRLNVGAMNADVNRAVFGKCNNPNSHGHNYRVDTEVGISTETCAKVGINAAIEIIVDRVIIEPFDHTNLNLDTAAFANSTGENPSVENIARVFYGLLSPVISSEIEAGELVSITVWETDRTSCRYPA